MINLLFVDDDISLCKTVKRTCEKKGYKVEYAFDGKEAMEKLKTFIPDFIITDIQMDRMNGNELIEKLKKSGSTIPVIALTEKPDKISTLNADAYLPKPFGIEILNVTINQLFLKNKSAHNNESVCKIGLYTFDSRTRSLCFTPDGKRIELRPKEALLLELLYKNMGCDVQQEQLINAIWFAAEKENAAHNLGTLIYNLRGHLSGDKRISITVTRHNSMCLEVL